MGTKDLAWELLREADTAGADPGSLDEVVHDLLSLQASDINNQGLGSQIQFILRECGSSAGEAVIRKALGL